MCVTLYLVKRLFDASLEELISTVCKMEWFIGMSYYLLYDMINITWFIMPFYKYCNGLLKQ